MIVKIFSLNQLYRSYCGIFSICKFGILLLFVCLYDNLSIKDTITCIVHFQCIFHLASFAMENDS